MVAARRKDASMELHAVAAAKMRIGSWMVNTSILLICAVLASLALGVLIAYWLCLAMFHLFRVHSQQVQHRRSLQHAGATQS